MKLSFIDVVNIVLDLVVYSFWQPAYVYSEQYLG